ncbi:hypothetical protein ACLOJK_024014, partial [Asimina triloba]
MSPPPSYRGGATEFLIENIIDYVARRGGYDPYPCPATIASPAAGVRGSVWGDRV